MLPASVFPARRCPASGGKVGEPAGAAAAAFQLFPRAPGGNLREGCRTGGHAPTAVPHILGQGEDPLSLCEVHLVLRTSTLFNELSQKKKAM